MQRIYLDELKNYIDKEVEVYCFVKTKRDQGKLVFFDLEDSKGFAQAVVLPKSNAIEVAKTVKEESVIKIKGIVAKRPEKNINPDIENGDIELKVEELEIINQAETIPFPIHTDTREVDENLRLKYRYLDLRSKRMKKNLINRFKVQTFLRDQLIKQDFIEVETPILSAPTPEGARSFIVPHRIWHGNFYALPQSPQQYKELLMVAEVDRYFQFARCMRDEDSRGDRQPEFTQLDMELSFVDEKEIMKINEELIINMVKAIYPHKKIQQIPFPVLTYKEVMEKYGTDRPDLRENKDDENLLAFAWIVDFPMFEEKDEDSVDELADNSSKWTFSHNPFALPKKEHMQDFLNKKNIGNILSTQYDLVLNGYEIAGGSLRAYKREILETTLDIIGYSKEKQEKYFGHMLKAYSFGAPPHGGIAWGFDRVLMILENEKSIREVIPFAKTGEGKELTLKAPAPVSQEQLDELGISVKEIEEIDLLDND